MLDNILLQSTVNVPNMQENKQNAVMKSKSESFVNKKSKDLTQI